MDDRQGLSDVDWRASCVPLENEGRGVREDRNKHQEKNEGRRRTVLTESR